MKHFLTTIQQTVVHKSGIENQTFHIFFVLLRSSIIIKNEKHCNFNRRKFR
jgi:hypothetical protein